MGGEGITIRFTKRGSLRCDSPSRWKITITSIKRRVRRMELTTEILKNISTLRSWATWRAIMRRHCGSWRWRRHRRKAQNSREQLRRTRKCHGLPRMIRSAQGSKSCGARPAIRGGLFMTLRLRPVKRFCKAYPRTITFLPCARWERMVLARLQFPQKLSGDLPRHCRRRVNSDSRRLSLVEVRIPDLGAFRAHGMGELHLRAIPDVGLDLLPVAGFLNFLARGADGENAGQSLHIGESLLQIGDHLILPGFFLRALADVAAVDDHATNGRMIQHIVGHDFERDPRAVGVLGAVLDGTSRAGTLPEFGQRIFHRGAVFGVNQFETGGADQFLLLITQNVVDGRTGVENSAIGVANGENVVVILDHLAELVVQLV